MVKSCKRATVVEIKFHCEKSYFSFQLHCISIIRYYIEVLMSDYIAVAEHVSWTSQFKR